MTISILALMLVTAMADAQTTTPSPDGTRSPPAPEIVDAQGNRWQIGVPTAGPGRNLDNVNLMVICNNIVYARVISGQWYRGNVGAGWTLVSMIDPCS